MPKMQTVIFNGGPFGPAQQHDPRLQEEESNQEEVRQEGKANEEDRRQKG